MNKRTMFISLVLAMIFVFTIVNADTPGILDIDKSSGYAKDAILALAEKDIVKGDNLGNFNPTKSISRAEFVTLLVRVMNLDTENVPATATFKDVPTSHWAFKYVEAAYKAGIVNGISPTEFGINQISTREQMAAMFVRALKLMDSSEQIDMIKIGALTDKNKISTWAQRDVDVAMTAGLMNGMTPTTFGPKANATKEQTAVVIDRFMGKEDTIAENVKTAYGLNKEIQYPNLYNVLKSDMYAEFTGDIKTNMNVQMTDLDTKDFFKSYNEVNSTFSDKAVHLYSNTKFETNTDEPIVNNTEMIITGNKIYEHDTDGKWIEYDRSQWENDNALNALSMTGISGTGVVTEDFLAVYNKMPIQEAGTEEIDGKTAEKYVMSLDSEQMKSFLTQEELDELQGALGEAYQGTDKYDIIFYIADGHLVKEVMNISGIASDSDTGMKLEVKIEIAVAYSNIGVITPIELPNAADIKQPVQE